MSPEQPDLLWGTFHQCLVQKCPFESLLPPKQRVLRKAAGRGRALSCPGDTCASSQVEVASLSCPVSPGAAVSAGAGTVPGSTFGCVLVPGPPQSRLFVLPAAALTCARRGSEVCAR